VVTPNHTHQAHGQDTEALVANVSSCQFQLVPTSCNENHKTVMKKVSAFKFADLQAL